jgi:ABC-type multidrug transport system ATPase subunit
VTLTVQGVSKRYGDRQALRDVSFSAAAGERLALIGPNGAGKTTLLEIIAGVRRPDAGTVSAAKVGWVPQRVAVYGRLTVAENLRLFARLEKAPGEAVARMLELTGLDGAQEAGTLSGGNRQRLNVALGVLGDPPVLVLDEPSASLDPDQRERLWSFVAELPATIVFTTHDLAETAHADRVLRLDDGALCSG